MSSSVTRRGGLALAALVAIGGITAAWWALALWPTDADTAAWVTRTRDICFGTRPNGLPGPAGWIVLIGEPLGMLGFLFVVWGDAVRDGLRALRSSAAGRAALAGSTGLLFVAAGAVATRVADARDRGDLEFVPPAATAPRRLDRPAPPLALVNQHGDTVRLEAFRGRPVIVVFAYGHCETVCPLIVRDAIAARMQVPTARPALLMVTLDPWRDTPRRLPTIARAWEVPDDAHVLSGGVPEVEHTLDAWEIPRSRNERTGEILHPSTVHLIDRDGRLAFIAPGDPGRIAALVAQL
jgi:cytochrome oxidase Cu insertion factor (SCO1/SenC/PrrC family)